MQVLIIHDISVILAWLVGESLESAPVHIQNGYPHLQAQYDAHELTAVVLVVDQDKIDPELYEIIDNAVVLRVN